MTRINRKVLILNFLSVKQIRMIQANKKCLDCGIELVRNSTELVCPDCGLVEELIDGA